MLVQCESKKKGIVVCVSTFYYEKFQILEKFERITERTPIHLQCDHICLWVHSILSRMVREGVSEKVAVDTDLKEFRESSANFWGKGFPGRGHSKEKVLKPEHFQVLKESRKASGVEKEERYNGSRDGERVT